MAAIPKVQEPSMEEILASIRRIMADEDEPASRAPVRPEAAARPRNEAPRGEAGVSEPRPRRAAEPAPQERRPPPQHPAAAPPQWRAPPEPARHPPRVWLGDEDEAVFAEAAEVLRQARPMRRPARPEVPASHAEARAMDDQGAHPERASVPPDERRPARSAPPAPEGVREQHAPRPRVAHPRPDGLAGAQDGAGAQHDPRRDAPPDAARRRDLLSPNVDAAVMAAFHSLGDVVLPQRERTVEDLVKDILRPMLKDWLDANLPVIVEGLVRAEIERVARRPR